MVFPHGNETFRLPPRQFARPEKCFEQIGESFGQGGIYPCLSLKRGTNMLS